MSQTSLSTVQGVEAKSPGPDKYIGIPDVHQKAVEDFERVFDLVFARCWNPDCTVDFYPEGERCSCQN